MNDLYYYLSCVVGDEGVIIIHDNIASFTEFLTLFFCLLVEHSNGSYYCHYDSGGHVDHRYAQYTRL